MDKSDKTIMKFIVESDLAQLDQLEGFLNQLQQAASFNDELYAKLMLVLSEAVTNGMLHGNKLDKSKKVVTEAAVEPESKITITVTDEGEGFVPDEVPDPLAEENLLKTSGRGVYLMKEYADEVEYNDKGNQLKLVFNL